VNGDQVRRVGFRSRGGYDASQVDDLLRRIAVELDAGRPVGPVIAGATLRPIALALRMQSWAYDSVAVDWFLEQLQRQEDHPELAGTGADPWRDLPVGNYFTRKDPADLAKGTARPSFLEWRKQKRQDKECLAQECADAWADFGQQPGTRLQRVRAGVKRRELRTAEQQTIASLRVLPPTAVSTGGRTFAWKRARRSLFDEAGMPVLHASGKNYYYSAKARIMFADNQRWLQFPVRGTGRANAIMTAVDQAGNRVARYRLNHGVEITVHPGQQLTDELVLAIAISAPWLSSYFESPNQGG
jgi:DivIVA domain-containing protein